MINQEPTFKSIFGASWDTLPPVMKRHYANRPYSTDCTTVEGVLDTFCAGPMKWFSFLFWLLRGVPPHAESGVRVTVNFESDPQSKSFYFNRLFHFKTRKPYRFLSRMIQIQADEVVEVMAFGIGWRMSYLWENGRVTLNHKGYVLSVFGKFIPMPITWMIGKGYAEEIPVDDVTFDMFVNITHPLWGKIYEYKGRFHFVEGES